MAMRAYIYLTLLGLLMIGCQKAQDDLPGYADPVFFVNVTGLPVSPISAGIGGYYMFTRYSTENQRLTTIGTLGIETCSDGICPNSLRFELTMPEDMVIPSTDSIIQVGEYPFKAIKGADSIIYRIALRAEPHESVDSVIWIIDQTNIFIGDSAMLDFPNPDRHSIELRTVKNGTLRSSVTSSIDLAGLKSFPVVGIKAGFDTVGLINGFNIQAVSTGAPIVSFAWSNDSIGSNFFDQGFGLSQGTIKVTATDAQGSLATATLSQLDIAESTRKTTGFSYTLDALKFDSPGTIEGAAIQWIDADGIVWRSDWGDQTADQLFAVLSSEPYDLNEKVQKTRILRVAFKCFLYNELGEVMPLAGTGVIAMAYP